MRITASQGQSLADICLQRLGDSSRVHELLRLNPDLENSSHLPEAGMEIEIPEPHPDALPVVEFYRKRSIQISTMNA